MNRKTYRPGRAAPGFFLNRKGTEQMDAENYIGAGDWLAADALKGKIHTLTIESVEEVNFDNEQGKDSKVGLLFKGRELGIIANKTNTKLLIEGLGTSNTDDWVGRKITAGPNSTPRGLGFVLRAVKDEPFDDDIPF